MYNTTMRQQYDSISKYIISKYPQAIAKLVFRNQNVEVEEIRATTQISIKVGHTDIILKVKRPDIAIAMLNDNQPIDTIVKYTGLSEEAIEQLTASVRATT